MKELIDNVRTKSVITGSDNIEHLITIKKFPVFIGHTNENESVQKDLFFDMVWDICKDTGVIQLRNILNPDLVYSKYHSESIGNIWKNHRKLLVETITNVLNNKEILKSDILEIGGSNGKLASMVLNNNPGIKNWSIIEPNVSKPDNLDQRITIIDSFFEKVETSKKDIIVHSHTLEHINDINGFLLLVNRLLKDNGFHIFSIPNLYAFLKNKYINTINFEHTIFLTEEITDYLLAKNHFKILDKIHYKDHSVLYVTKKTKDILNYTIPNRYNEYKQMYLTCVQYYKDFVLDINRKMKLFNGDVYLFGGHIFSQFLLNLGLNSNRIKLILDNSEIKDDTRLYGFDLKIKKPSNVDIKPRSAIILKVGAYRKEILETLNEQIDDIIIWE